MNLVSKLAVPTLVSLVWCCMNENNESVNLPEIDCNTVKEINIYVDHLDVQRYLCYLKNNKGSAMFIDPSVISRSWLDESDIPFLLHMVGDTTPCAKSVNALLFDGYESYYESNIHDEVIVLMKYLLNNHRLFIVSDHEMTDEDVVEAVKKIMER